MLIYLFFYIMQTHQNKMAILSKSAAEAC